MDDPWVPVIEKDVDGPNAIADKLRSQLIRQ
jgi:hypothetical protein